MRPAAALTALALGSLLALAASAAAEPDPTDPSFFVAPVQAAAMKGLEDSAAVLTSGAAMFQERFDALRGIGEESANEAGAEVNACPVGGALPDLRVPRSTGELSADPAALVADLDAWGDDLSAPLNGEAECRSVQAAALGGPAVEPPAVPGLPALPDFPEPPEATLPAAPELAIPGAPDVPALPELPGL